MDTTRRWVLARALQLAGGILVLCRPWRAVAQRGTTWTTRRATPQDVGALVAIFNAHRAAGICPYADQMPLWTPAKAQAFLTVYTGTLIVERDGVPVGFGGLIDYSDPATSSSIAPDAEPEITVVAVDFERLAPREVVPAVTLPRRTLPPGGPLAWVSFRDETADRLQLSSVPLDDPEEKDIAVGDFDDDGDEDIIVVRKRPFSTFGPRAPLLLLNEDGILVDRTVAKLGDSAGPLLNTNARDVFVGDFDGGNAPDLAIANTCEEFPTFYQNKGGRCTNWTGFTRQDDGWRPPASGTGSFSVQGKRFCAVAGGDVDNDGDVDLYFSNYDTVCGSGDGGQGDPNPGAPSDKDVLLINKITGADATGRLMDESQAPANRLGELANVAFGTAAEILDVDRDGPAGLCDGSPTSPCDNDIVKVSTLFSVSPWKPNILSASDGIGVFILRNTGNGHFTWNGATSAEDILDLNQPYMFTGGDLNNDGKLDFYVVDDSADSVYVATGPSSYERRDVLSARTGGLGGNVKMADIDDNGYLDVGVADVDVNAPGCPSGRRFALLQNDGSGNLSDPYGTDEPFHVSTHDFAFVDLNGDGCLDLFTGVCSGYKVFMNTTPPKCQGGP
ncbi:MAG: FG-GAP-like repeat-containing protein [Candidatus Binatia bacterium]